MELQNYYLVKNRGLINFYNENIQNEINEKIICNYFTYEPDNLETEEYKNFIVLTNNNNIIDNYLNNICMNIYKNNNNETEKIILNIVLQEIHENYKSTIKYKYPIFYYQKYLFQKFSLTMHILINYKNIIENKIKFFEYIICNNNNKNNDNELLYLMQG